MNDPRLTPARSDLAAARLKGQVTAERFVEGVTHQVKSGVSCLHETPSLSARLETQLLHGETFVAYEERGGWLWGQNERDGYVGYALAGDFDTEIIAPSHRVVALRTIVFPLPDLKSQPHAFLSRNAKVAITDSSGRLVRLARGGYAPADHFAPITHVVEDWVAGAEDFRGAPYLWGGKDSFGLDCSGLVQTSLETVGIACLRNADMQEETLGGALGADAPLERGDLLFWDGHVAIVRNAHEILHANAFHMMTAIEPLADALARIGPPRTIKRL